MKVRINRAKWRGVLLQDYSGRCCVMGSIYKRVTHRTLSAYTEVAYNYLYKKYGKDKVWNVINANDDLWSGKSGASEANVIKAAKDNLDIDVEFYGERNG